MHSVVFGGFAARELAARIEDARPTVVLAASCGLEPTRVVPYKPLLDEALSLSSHKPGTVLVWQRPETTADLTLGAVPAPVASRALDAGAAGNLDAGMKLSLASAVPGVSGQNVVVAPGGRALTAVVPTPISSGGAMGLPDPI